MTTSHRRTKTWTLAKKLEVLSNGSKLESEALLEYLKREGVAFADYESWRLALDEGGTSAGAATRRIRTLERELARKEKALAETAALLVLKKKVDLLFPEDEDDDTTEGTEP